MMPPPTRGRGERGEGRGPRPGTAGGRVAARWGVGVLALAVLGITAGTARAAATGPEQRFREATTFMRGGDVPGALAIYRELAAGGHESVNLYWNWAQGAAARGQTGETMWALLRAREAGPADAAVEREIERLRQTLHLELAELNPVPTAGLGRIIRRFHLGTIAGLLLLASLGFHALARRRLPLLWPKVAGWAAPTLGLTLAVLTFAAAASRPTAVITTRDAALLDAASPTASSVATLREGEVVPVLDTAGSFLRVQDSSGARGWVRASDAWSLARPPAAPGPG